MILRRIAAAIVGSAGVFLAITLCITSAATQAADTTKPTAPTGLVATVVSSNQINLIWNASTDNVGVTEYRVLRCQGASCTNFARVGTSTTTSFDDTGLAAATTYRYRIRAVDAAGNVSMISNTVSATTQAAAPDSAPPSAPTGLGATAASASQINLSWTASADNVGVMGYRVERCQGAGCTGFAQIGTPPGTATTYNDTTGLVANTNYSYRVRAVDAAGNLGAYSNIASAVTPAGLDTTKPTAPTGLAATVVSSNQIDLIWNASTDNVGVTGYRVLRCQGASCTNFALVGTSTVTSFADTGLATGITYRYRVRAVDAAGNVSMISSTVSATTQAIPDTTAPSAPTGLSAIAANDAAITVAWTASIDNVGVTGYRVERCQGAGCSTFVQISAPTITSFYNTGLTGSTSYSYRVLATDGAGNLSGYSHVGSATTLPPGATVSLAAAPTSITSGESSTLTWSSTNATSCTASGAWTGSKAIFGSETLGPLATTSTFTLSCSGVGGSASQSVTVTIAGANFGLDFPGSAAVATTMRFRFLNPLAIYPATYIWRAYPRQQAGFYTAFFWANDDGRGTLATFLWKGGIADTYYGAHPYPRNHTGAGTVHDWEIAIQQLDPTNGEVVKDRWYTQVFVADGQLNAPKYHTFYWNWPNTDASSIVTYTAPATYGNVNPPVPALTWGDAPWAPGDEVWNGILRGIQIYDVVLTPAEIAAEIANPGSIRTPWYLNLNPTPTDITDKSGNGHHPEWVGNERPGLWSQ